MTWHHGRMLAFDLETTGIDPHRDRIVTAALVEVGGGRDQHAIDHLLDPGITIPAGAAAVHGITTDHARTHGRSAITGTREIAEYLLSCTSSGVPVVAYNGSYDLTMLWAELVRHDHHGLAQLVAGIRPVVDPFVLDKAVDPYRKGSRKLIDVAAHYGITLSQEDAHGAHADALTAARVAWMIAARYPDVQLDLEQLHDAQVEWKRSQADSFGRYLTRQGKTDDVAREWPIQPAPPGWAPDQLPAAREDAVA